LLYELYKQGIFGFEEVEKVINERIIKRTQGRTKIQKNGWFSYLENSEK
jgi:hypothetical protein